MPISKFQFTPGINRENTNYSNEGGFYSCDKIRFRSGFPEKIGGWVNYSEGNTFCGVPRSLLNWTSYSGESLIAFGTTQKYLVLYNSQYQDITPIRTTLTATVLASTDTTKYIVVTVSAHSVSAGTWVSFASSTTFNGVTISGEYEVVEVIDGDTFTIASANVATATGSTSISVDVTFKINAGPAAYTIISSGWGVGPWGNGPWGIGVPTTGASSIGTQLRIWSQANFGENLVFAYSSGPMYWWDKDTSTFAAGVELGEAAAGATKTSKPAAFGSGATAMLVPDNIGINSGAIVSGIGIPEGTYVTTDYTGGNIVPLSTSTTGASSGIYTFSYSQYHVPAQVTQVVVSDISQFVIAIGATPYDPTNFSPEFSPMLVRWSDQSNPYEWVSEATNQAGDQILSNGSYLVCAKSTRQEILIWSDSALYSMQYVGAPYVFSFQMMMDNISIISPNAAITVNNITYWMGKDKFYVYSGQIQTLPCTLRAFVFNDLNETQGYQIVCGSNPAFNEVWWLYPSSGSLVNDRYVVYNYLENIWYYGTMNRTAWLSAASIGSPLAVHAVQCTFLSDAISDTEVLLAPLVNSQTFPTSGTVIIGDEQLSYTSVGGGLVGLTRGVNGTTAAAHAKYSRVMFYIPNQLVSHEQGTDDYLLPTARPIESYIESSDVDIGDGDHFAFVRRILPDLSFDTATSENPAVTLTISPRKDSGSAYVTPVPEPTVVQIDASTYTGQVYTRVRGRQLSFKIASYELGSSWQLGSMRFDIRADGRRA